MPPSAGLGLNRRRSCKAQPGYGPALCVLGLIDAALGRKEEALSEGGARSNFFL